jgi:hypothetical protein
MILRTSPVAVCCWRRPAQLVEQPRIFDSDYGLVGEGGDQINLLLREWLDPGTPQK